MTTKSTMALPLALAILWPSLGQANGETNPPRFQPPPVPLNTQPPQTMTQPPTAAPRTNIPGQTQPPMTQPPMTQPPVTGGPTVNGPPQSPATAFSRMGDAALRVATVGGGLTMCALAADGARRGLPPDASIFFVSMGANMCARGLAGTKGKWGRWTRNAVGSSMLATASHWLGSHTPESFRLTGNIAAGTAGVASIGLFLRGLGMSASRPVNWVKQRSAGAFNAARRAMGRKGQHRGQPRHQQPPPPPRWPRR